MTHAFQGLRILDFSQVLAGPACTSYFAMLGADVIKIENPASGDQFRNLMKTDRFAEFGMSPGFMALNFGKRSLAIDLKKPEARDVIFRLIETADVIVENFRAGVIDNLGFGYDAVRKVKPDIVYCSVSGYGQEGPKAGAPAYDGAIQASSGMMSVTGHPETGPTRAGYTVVDMSTALTAAFAISSALYRRRETGEGQRVDVAMLDTAMWMMSPLLANFLVGAEAFGLKGNNSPAMTPTSNVFQASDGYLQITGLTDQHAAGIVAALELDAKADPRLTSYEAMCAHHDAVKSIFTEKIRRKPVAYWLAEFSTRKVPHSLIRDFAGVTSDPQLEHRGIIRDVPVPNSGNAKSATVPLIGAAFIADADGPDAFGPPPVLGEHGAAILGEAGFSADEIATLREAGVLGEPAG